MLLIVFISVFIWIYFLFTPNLRSNVFFKERKMIIQSKKKNPHNSVDSILPGVKGWTVRTARSSKKKAVLFLLLKDG